MEREERLQQGKKQVMSSGRVKSARACREFSRKGVEWALDGWNGKREEVDWYCDLYLIEKGGENVRERKQKLKRNTKKLTRRVEDNMKKWYQQHGEQ
eukprot:evm.model.NODE_34240_length_32379_cov_28.507706.10